MMHPRRRALALVILAAIPVMAAAQLNPTVKVLTRPKSAVPAECDQGLATQPAQRLTTEERTSVRDTSRDMLAPPTASLKGELEAAFVAAQHSSRQAFRDALTQAKSLLVSYPPGGERTAAANLVDVLDDVDRIWEYQFTSPTGAFFDASSEPFRIASKYPGYDAAIRRQIIVDQNGNRFYPTHETRDFLIAESGQRLPRVTGKPAPRAAVTRVAPVAPSTESTTKPKPQHTMKQTTTQTTMHATQTTTHATRPSHRRATHKPVVREARATTQPPRTTRAHTTTAPKPAPKPAPAPVVHKATPPPATELAPTHPPIVSETAATTPPPPTTSTASTSMTPTTVAPSESTTTTETTTTATTESNPAGKPAQSRSLLGPILLIIVGVGLLLTLWRASS